MTNAQIPRLLGSPKRPYASHLPQQLAWPVLDGWATQPSMKKNKTANIE